MAHWNCFLAFLGSSVTQKGFCSILQWQHGDSRLLPAMPMKVSSNRRASRTTSLSSPLFRLQHCAPYVRTSNIHSSLASVRSTEYLFIFWRFLLIPWLILSRRAFLPNRHYAKWPKRLTSKAEAGQKAKTRSFVNEPTELLKLCRLGRHPGSSVFVRLGQVRLRLRRSPAAFACTLLYEVQ
jgi:hypothetical protein